MKLLIKQQEKECSTEEYLGLLNNNASAGYENPVIGNGNIKLSEVYSIYFGKEIKTELCSSAQI